MKLQDDEEEGKEETCKDGNFHLGDSVLIIPVNSYYMEYAAQVSDPRPGRSHMFIKLSNGMGTFCDKSANNVSLRSRKARPNKEVL